MRLALSGAAVTFLALALCSNASAEDGVPSQTADSGALPACSSGLRLRAVQFDPHREERSFALFSGSARPQKQGARIGAYTIDHIDRGAVVLTGRAQRCSLKLNGDLASRELRAVSADAVRSGLRARQPAAAVHNTAATSSTRIVKLARQSAPTPAIIVN